MVTAAWRAQRMLIGGDDDARRAHAEGLGEGIVDRNAVDLHDVPGLRRLHDDLAAAAVDDLVVAERGSSPCAPCGSGRSIPSAASRSTLSYSRPRHVRGALHDLHHLAVAHDDLAVLEDELGRREHRLAVGCRPCRR